MTFLFLSKFSSETTKTCSMSFNYIVDHERRYVDSINGKKGVITIEPFDDSIEIINDNNHLKILATGSGGGSRPGEFTNIEVSGAAELHELTVNNAFDTTITSNNTEITSETNTRIQSVNGDVDIEAGNGRINMNFNYAAGFGLGFSGGDVISIDGGAVNIKPPGGNVDIQTTGEITIGDHTEHSASINDVTFIPTASNLTIKAVIGSNTYTTVLPWKVYS